MSADPTGWAAAEHAPGLPPGPGARGPSKAPRPQVRPRVIGSSSIRRKLATFAALMLTSTVAILTWAVDLFTERMLLDQMSGQLQGIASDRRAILLGALQQQNERVDRIVGRVRLGDLIERRVLGLLGDGPFRAEATRNLLDVRDKTEGVRSIRIADPSGRVIAATDPEDLGADVSGDEAFRQGIRERYVLDPEVHEGQAQIRVAAPMRSRSGQLRAVALVRLDFGPAVAALTDRRGLGTTGQVKAGTRRGDGVDLWLSTASGLARRRVPADRRLPLAAAALGSDGFVRTRDESGRDVFAAYRTVGYGGWGLVAQIDAAEAFGRLYRLHAVLGVLGVGFVLAGVVGSLLVADWFTRPLLKLADAASQVAAGDLQARSGIVSNDEIGRLGTAFDHMADELAISHALLERRVAERTLELEASRDLLDEFFTITTTLKDPGQLDQTFDSMLRCCRRLGYDLAMLSLVDREQNCVRAVKAAGSFAEILGRTVRPLDGTDILALVVREERPAVVRDATRDPRCDQEAAAMSGIRGLIVLPLQGREVLGTLQVGSRQEIDPATLDPRPLETLASQAARALEGLRQLAEIHQLNHQLGERAQALARSEDALLRQTKLLQLILDCLGDGVVVGDDKGDFVLFNPAAERILGLGPSRMQPEQWVRHYGVYLPDGVTLCPPGELPLIRAIGGEAVEDRELFIRHALRPGGLWISVSARPLRDEDDALRGGVVVFRDVTERKRGEGRLAIQLATTRAVAEAGSTVELIPRLLETIGGAIGWDFGAYWRVDGAEGLIRCLETWRPEGAGPLRFEAVTRQAVFSPGEGLLGRVWGAGEPLWVPDVAAESRFVRGPVADDEPLGGMFAFPVVLRGDVIGLFEFFCREPRPPDADLLLMLAGIGTQVGQFVERDQMHARVVQAEKMASLGLMSAGVAHEINNPLAYVANNLAVVERDFRSLGGLLDAYEEGMAELRAIRPELAEKVGRIAEEIDLAYLKAHLGPILGSTRKGVKRVADIVQNLRGFARLDRAAVDRMSLHDAINSSLEMIKGRLDRRGIAVELRYGELPTLACSPAQINQVFLNLLVNAMQAVESSGHPGGRIVVTTRADAEAGTAVVEIEDNGVGIPPSVLPRIFDPFFTTKTIGEGTGLGLSITHGIVADHGGRIEVESTPGRGTRFRVVLPTAEKGKPR